ncbi:MAG: DUF927 domain-containing protein [Lachnospiraceae bacterium]|nr:DUF927 domain-containing protein [Lachnospiraceae bacterium]
MAAGNGSGQNIDDFVNYESEYRHYVKQAVVLGDKMTGLCPFHSDSNNSFSVDLKTGKWHCFTEEIGGNFLDFYGKIHGCDTKEAYQEVLKQYGRYEEKPESSDYSLEQYAKDKGFDVRWLKDNCRLSTGKKRKTGVTFLKIPYFDPEGKPTVFRERYARKEFRWGYGAKGKINLYGEWRLQAARQGDSMILVEGESDSQSLWRMGLPALGVPGASLFKPEHVEVLKGFDRLYLHKEQDSGGETFIRKTMEGLRRGGFDGAVFMFSCGSISGCKDPSDIYLRLGAEEGKTRIKKLIESATPVDLSEPDPVPEHIQGAPVNLRSPEGWTYDESGIYEIKPKTFEEVFICGTPIIITRRVKSLDGDADKIGIAVLKTEARRKVWTETLLKRDEVYTSKATTILTNLGAMINSENIKPVIRFLSALEAVNDDIIPWGESTSTLGWHSKGRFLPGVDKGLIMDFDEQMGAVVSAYHTHGSLEKWARTMQEHREKNRFRFLLAASFAAPMIKLLHHRTFFVYNWGDARGGKTAALKAALSVWGEPDGLMMNFNTTQVGLERQAALFTDLPLGIDERQAAGSGAYGQSRIENLVYMIGEGKGRTRGAKNGGIQKVNRWRTIALATGEEPLSSETSMTGVSSRIIEICKGPFRDEVEAGKMHIDCAANYGFAGPAFVKRLAGVSAEDLKEQFDRMIEYVRGVGKGKAGSHVSGIALIALADALANDWIFTKNDEKREKNAQMDVESAVLEKKLSISIASWTRACEMAKEIMREQIPAASRDVNENATRFLADWVFINKASFTDYATTRLGMMGEDDGTVLIISTALSDALRTAGYNERKTKAYLAEKGYISTFYDEAKDKMEYSYVKRLPPGKDGKIMRTRVVEFYIDKALGDSEGGELPDDGFMPVGEDEDLPFD